MHRCDYFTRPTEPAFGNDFQDLRGRDNSNGRAGGRFLPGGIFGSPLTFL